MHHTDAQRDRIMWRANLAHLAVDYNLTAIGCVEAVGDPHSGRLARAIFADYGMNGSGLDLETDAIVGQDVTKTFCDVS